MMDEVKPISKEETEQLEKKYQEDFDARFDELQKQAKSELELQEEEKAEFEAANEYFDALEKA